MRGREGERKSNIRDRARKCVVIESVYRVSCVVCLWPQLCVIPHYCVQVCVGGEGTGDGD